MLPVPDGSTGAGGFFDGLTFIPAPYNRAVISVTNPSVSDYVLPTIKNDVDLTKLCSALRSVDSIRLVKSLELKDEHKILTSVLLSYDKKEWDDARLELMNYLNSSENLVYFVDAVNQKNFNITPQNRPIIISLISKTINVYDWSDFLDRYIDELRDRSLGDENLFEFYRDSSFCKQNVLDKIKNEVILLLKDNIADDRCVPETPVSGGAAIPPEKCWKRTSGRGSCTR